MRGPERQLTQGERDLASWVRHVVPEDARLRVCQEIGDVADQQREIANKAVVEARVSEDQRVALWKALDFPRYRFFHAAMPDRGWNDCIPSHTERHVPC